MERLKLSRLSGEERRRALINWGVDYVLAQLDEQIPEAKPPYPARIDHIPRGFLPDDFVECVGARVQNRTGLEFNLGETTKASKHAPKEVPGFSALHLISPGATLIFTRLNSIDDGLINSGALGR